jgi:predicted ATP-grasp superfamily ATP-dependent carboligase
MKLFVYEHITSGALAEQKLPLTLAKEGDQMLLAALQDSHDTQQCTLITLRDKRLNKLPLFQQNPQHHCYIVTTLNDYHHAWEQCLQQCDTVLIIAPETDNILARLQQQAVNAGKALLGSRPETIQLCTDKLQCYQHLVHTGLPTISTLLASQWQTLPFNNQNGYILKPRDGAGCINTFYFKSRLDLEKYLASKRAPELEQYLIQPYLPGNTISLCLLASNSTIEVLSTNQQHLEQSQGQLSLSACTINNTDDLPDLMQTTRIAQKLHTSLPGLYGFIGVDLISNQQGLFIVDINPRHTTSYIGLNASLNLNPMQRFFDIIGGKSTQPITQRQTIELTL